jgi:D-tyrosyl-tRNA(Tyr) deacylase
MRVVLQRVRQGSVRVAGEVIGQCGQGFVILVGVGHGDTPKEADYLTGKIANLRVFEDAQGKMNLSALDLEPKGEILLISQFTLYADVRKGRRPGFGDSATPAIAAPLVDYLGEKLREAGLAVETGRFGAEMLVDIQNDGPVTIIMDTATLL